MNIVKSLGDMLWPNDPAANECVQISVEKPQGFGIAMDKMWKDHIWSNVTPWKHGDTIIVVLEKMASFKVFLIDITEGSISPDVISKSFRSEVEKI